MVVECNKHGERERRSYLVRREGGGGCGPCHWAARWAGPSSRPSGARGRAGPSAGSCSRRPRSANEETVRKLIHIPANCWDFLPAVDRKCPSYETECGHSCYCLHRYWDTLIPPLATLGPNTTYVWASLDSSLNLVVGQTEWPYCQQGNTDDCHFKNLSV